MKKISLPKIPSHFILFFIIPGALLAASLVNWPRLSLPRGFDFGKAAAAQSGAWTQQTSGVTDTLWSVHFINDNRGWAAGENATLLRTSNGGASWTPVSNCVSAFDGFFSVRFLNSNEGWAGGAGAAAQTGDGGTNFNCGVLDVNAFHNSLFPTSANRAWSAGFYVDPNLNCRFLSRITFGGASFTEENFTGCPGPSLFDIYFVDANNGWAVGESGEIVHIANAAATTPTITSQTSGTTQLLWGVFMLDPSAGWAVGDAGTILKTTNGGANWMPQTSGTSTDLRDVHFINANTGWVVGVNGVILTTNDGGANWTPEVSGVTEELDSVYFSSPNVGYAVGENGVILKRIAGCASITVDPPTIPSGTAGVAYPPTTFTATGGNEPYTFTRTGALPAGMTFISGTLSGTPTQTGAFPITVTATDASGCPGSRSYTLTINCPAITVNPPTLPGGTVGTPYSQTLTATGGIAPYSFSVTAGSLPPGLTLGAGGALMGTPATPGTFNFTVRATDANGCAGSRAYTVAIAPGAAAGLQYYPLLFPVRLLDTRPGELGCYAPGQPIAGGTSRTQPARGACNGLTIPANAAAITGNITTVQSGGGFLTLYPSDAERPLVSNSNFNPNEIINNVFTVGLGAADGAFKIFVLTTTDVVVDVTGYYAPPGAGGLYFHPLPRPVRLLETRAGESGCYTPGAPLPGNFDSTQQATGVCDGLTIPSAARAIVGNATTVNPGGGFLTLFPADAARPLAASSNYLPGQIMNAPFIVGLSPSGAFKIYPLTQTDLVIDVLGYYSPEATDVNGAGLLFNPLAHPVRLLETRDNPGFPGCYKTNAPLQGGVVRTQPARGVCDGLIIPSDALGIVGNATVVNPNGTGYLTFWPSDATQPLVATSNFTAGQIFNRHFTVGLSAGAGAFNIFSLLTTDLVIDVSGYFAP
jgi:photosystem II stability/assembly factor-like uncharacterized protein